MPEPHAPLPSEPAGDPLEDRVFAAVDLGSNSFHLVVGRLHHGSFHMLDRLREPVRLAAGLGKPRIIAADAKERALACLMRFGERLRDVPPERVRAVGTNTLRRARDAAAFVVEASRALGHEIEIISGEEEARLVYLGVSHTLAEREGRRLVVDIGGGSTEVILGERFAALSADSFAVGCVETTRRWFPEGKLSADGMKAAVLAVRTELAPHRDTYGSGAWTEAIGSSGTILTVEDILVGMGWSERGITPDGLERLRKHLATAADLNAVSLPGLSEERKPVFPGGVAILAAVFKTFGIERMDVSSGALREGVLYQLLGRVRHEDVRDLSVRSFAARFGVDKKQAERVAATARRLVRAAAEAWRLELESADRFLEWAALLHEVGMSVSHSSHHKHGAYLLANTDLPGFSRDDQLLLAALVRSHRRKVDEETLDALPVRLRAAARLLAALLRIAVTLHRSRRARALPAELRIEAGERTLTLKFPADWLDAHPLLAADLFQEIPRTAVLGVTLSFA